MSGRKPNRTSAHHRTFVGKFFLGAPFIDVDGTLRLGAVLLGKKALQRPDGDGTVDLATAERGLAGMPTHSPADAGKGIRIASESIGFFEATFGNQADVAPSVGVSRAG